MPDCVALVLAKAFSVVAAILRAILYLFLPEERRNEGSRDGICLIEAKAKIRHKKSGGFGAEFTDLSDQAEEKLARFINTYRTQP